MNVVSTAGRQAEFLAALAQHMGTHHVALSSVLGLNLTAQLRTLDGAGTVAAWARSVQVEQVAVMPISQQDWSAVQFSTELAGHTVQVWARVDGLPGDVTSLTVDELAYFADYATLPPGAGS